MKYESFLILYHRKSYSICAKHFNGIKWNEQSDVPSANNQLSSSGAAVMAFLLSHAVSISPIGRVLPDGGIMSYNNYLEQCHPVSEDQSARSCSVAGVGPAPAVCSTVLR